MITNTEKKYDMLMKNVAAVIKLGKTTITMVHVLQNSMIFKNYVVYISMNRGG